MWLRNSVITQGDSGLLVHFMLWVIALGDDSFPLLISSQDYIINYEGFEMCNFLLGVRCVKFYSLSLFM